MRKTLTSAHASTGQPNLKLFDTLELVKASVVGSFSFSDGPGFESRPRLHGCSFVAGSRGGGGITNLKPDNTVGPVSAQSCYIQIEAYTNIKFMSKNIFCPPMAKKWRTCHTPSPTKLHPYQAYQYHPTCLSFDCNVKSVIPCTKSLC